MNKKEEYSRSAVIIATVGWLMVGSLLAFVLIIDRVRNLGRSMPNVIDYHHTV